MADNIEDRGGIPDPDPFVEKYKDKVDPEWVMAMQAIAMVRQMLNIYRPQYEELLTAWKNMDDFGGMLDPTLYRDALYSKSFAQQLRVVNGALAFLKLLDDVEAEYIKAQVKK